MRKSRFTDEQVVTILHGSPASSSAISFAERVHRLAFKPGERVRSLRGYNTAPSTTLKSMGCEQLVHSVVNAGQPTPVFSFRMALFTRRDWN